MRALLVLLAWTAVAVAQPSPEATKLFEEGRELAKQQKWPEACDRFQKSLALDPAPGTKLNLGDCLEKQGKIRAGWLMFEEAARDFDRTNDSRAKFAHDRAATAASKLATVVIKLAEPTLPGISVRVGDRDAVAQAEIVERVDPGSLFITVKATDKQVFTTEVIASGGKTSVVDVPELENAVHQTQRAEEPATTSPRRRRVITGIAIGAAGGAALVTSGVLALLARSQYNAAIDDECFVNPVGGERICTPHGKAEVDAAGKKADLATGFAIAGVALAAIGAVIYVTAPEERSTTVTPTVTSSSVGVAFGGTF